ncbi:MAG TPA: hypothetical protein VLK66_27110 [Longimicrobium sp.]|nr:hypothetical protein [Longimicrobium sp.]
MRFNTGIYTPPEAAALLHEKPETVRRWAFGYTRQRTGGKTGHPPLIRTELPVVEGERTLTFVELVELLYVRAFHDARVGWSTIREAASVAARLFATDHPFALRQVYLDPGSFLYAAVEEADGTEALIELRGHGQHAIPQLVKPYLDQLEFGTDDVASRWWPMGRRGGVVVDPRIGFGAPVIEDTGIRTGTLCDAFTAERATHGKMALERVAWLYELKPAQVEDALRFHRWLKAA